MINLKEATTAEFNALAKKYLTEIENVINNENNEIVNKADKRIQSNHGSITVTWEGENLENAYFGTDKNLPFPFISRGINNVNSTL